MPFMADQELLFRISPIEAHRFDAWISDLERHMKGWDKKWGVLPYDLPLSESTGLQCWYESFELGMMPLEAFHSDQENWD